ncbi:MAG: bifunctional diguanylate cyclase/phosphodiesterase [Pseudomonadota bacterium]
MSDLTDVDHPDLHPLELRVAQLEARLATDSLTGARSREYFYDHYPEFASAHGSLYFIDLDNFKSVNDHYGHKQGDRLLQKIVEAVRGALRGDDFIARVGGDEFIVLSKRSRPTDVEAMSEALITSCLSARLTEGELTIRRAASIGCLRLTPSIDTNDALDLGDTAMRCAKNLGKGRAHHLNMLDAENVELNPSIDELRLALERSEVGYYLQPIFSCATRDVVGYEALLRWERPNGQVLAPAQFLDTMTDAYSAKARPPLEFARAATEWVTLGQKGFCCFNISMAFLERIAGGETSWVNDIIGASPRERIVFEITETAIESEVEAVSGILNTLRASGIRIALDDFGVGASNLERLQSMPVDIVKIDRRFVRSSSGNQKSRDLLSGMIDLAHKAGAQIVVEGIEEEANFDLVRSLGAEYAQGFHLGKPLPYQRG